MNLKLVQNDPIRDKMHDLENQLLEVAHEIEKGQPWQTNILLKAAAKNATGDITIRRLVRFILSNGYDITLNIERIR